MAKLATKDQRLAAGVTRPRAVYSRVFGLACKANAGVGVSDFTYSPQLGNNVWLQFMSLWYGGGDHTGNCAGIIHLTQGSGTPTEVVAATRWEYIVPFWAGLTKPGITVQGREGYLSWPMNRPYRGEAMRFALVIENGSGAFPFWVNVWFEVSEG